MSNVGDPAVYAAAITPADGTDLPSPCRSIYVGVTGNIALVTVGGNTVTFSNVPVGVLPVQARRVLATGTTATTMIAMW